MKCNFSINGFCRYNTSGNNQKYQFKASNQSSEEIAQIATELETNPTFFIGPPNIEIIPLSGIKCNGQEDKEGCPVRKW